MSGLMKKLIFLSFFGIAQFSFSETVFVKYGWQIFRNAGDGRSLALGKALTAGGKGIPASLWNPANLVANTKKSFTYVYQSRFSGVINSDLISFPIHKFTSKPFGFILIHEEVPGIPDTRYALLDENGDGKLNGNERLDSKNVTEFSQHQWGVYLNRSWVINKSPSIGSVLSKKSVLLGDVIFGIGVKGLIHQLGSHTGTGFGLDAGLRTLFWKRVQAGIVIQDVFTSWLVWDNGTKEIVTPRVSVGISGNYDLPLIPVTLGLMADFIVETEGHSTSEDSHLGSFGKKSRVGMEWTIKENIQIRFGRNETGIISTGLGLVWSDFEISYALQTAVYVKREDFVFELETSSLGNSHLLSFSIDPKLIMSKLSPPLDN